MIIEANETNLNELMKEGFSIVDFFSDTCGPCKLLAPVLATLESELPFINVIKVNTSKYPNYSKEFDIQAVPTILFLNEGVLKERTLGFMPLNVLQEKVGKYLYE